MCKTTNSTMAKYQKPLHLSNKVLQQLVTTENSCVEVQKNRKHITLSPYHLKSIKSSIKEILEEGIAKYSRDLDGILLGYKHIKLLNDTGATDPCFIHLDIEADFVVFKPVPGKELPAIVTKKSKDHVGCLVYHTFNVSLPKPEGIENWTGSDVTIGQEIIVRVTYANLEGRLPYIKGEFLNNISERTDKISGKASNKKKKFEDVDEVPEETKVKKKNKKKRKHEEIEDELEQTLDAEEVTEYSHKKKKRKHEKEREEEDQIEEFQTEMKKRKKSKMLEEDVESTIESSSPKKKKKKSLEFS